MKIHLINLVLRFFLEMTSLIGIGVWGWRQGEGWTRWVFAVGLPLIMSTIWGVFNVPDDPSRGGGAPVPVPGIVRLFIEAIFFGCGLWALIAMGYEEVATLYIVFVIVHYVVGYGRIMWLLK